MNTDASLTALRDMIRAHYLADETTLTRHLTVQADIGAQGRRDAQSKAAAFVKTARANASRSGLIDKFLQEYGLSTAEGVTLMRLAEALLRTPDAATADALIADKVEAGDWAAHKGKSPFPLVNFSTRALMFTAAWLDEFEAKDPTRKMVKATKAVLDRVGEPVIRASVAQAMRIMGEHFVLGETIDAAMRRGREFENSGYLFSFDMLGEAAHTQKDADRYFDDYKKAISSISRYANASRAADNPGISVKLSALHPRYEYVKKSRVLEELGARIRELALAARAANMGFNIDAEEADRLDLSLDLIEALMRDDALSQWDGFGVVVQAYQRRAPCVIDWLAALARETDRRVMVRLVKGAYWDAEIKRAQVMGLESYPVFTRKVSTDVSFTACARKLLMNTDVFYPQFATHNALTATMVREMADRSADYEFQRLHGMGEALHDSLIKQGARSRIYAPVGGHKELLPYLVRRLLENGANSSFVNQLIDPDLSVDDVVADPIDDIAVLDVIPNPAIPAPCDLFAGERLLAKGEDWTHPPTAANLSPGARETLAATPARAIVNGDRIDGVLSPIINPAHSGDAVGSVEPATAVSIEKACAIAAEAAPRWAATPAKTRGDALRAAGDLLESRADQFMALAVFEAGKTWPDAVAEIREAVDFCRYYANEAERLHLSPSGRGRNLLQQISGEGEETSAFPRSALPPHPNPLPNGERESDGARLQPLGVVACISPWNFPLAIFVGQITGALAAANTVIAKPAEQTPLIAFEAVNLLHEAGVPEDVLHFLPGDGAAVGAPLVAHKVIGGVVFTGSTEVAKRIKRSLVESGKPEAALIAETGGINAMIIDSTAFLEQAVTDVIASAFQSAGQRCSACRLVCIQDDTADRFLEMLAGAMAELKTGDPSDLSTDVGPVIDEEAQTGIERHIEEMTHRARLIARAPTPQTDVHGAFVRPAAFELECIDDLHSEIFGPVLHVVRYKADRLEETIDAINAKGYGLTLGVHTRIDETMHQISARARVGNIYVNRNQIGAVVGVQPFGGVGLSGTGPKAGGPHYVRALTRRPAPAGENAIRVCERELNEVELADLEKARDVFALWTVTARRNDVIKTLNDHRFSIGEDPSSVDYIELPGPTGESNTLRLRGRGVVLCLGGSDEPEVTHTQIATALSAGNTVIVAQSIAQSLCASILDAGAPTGLITGMEMDDGVPEGLLLHDAITAVVFDGGRDGRAALENILARRPGAIIPVLTSNDELWRYGVERTLTINTTAAGGDVRLLSLAD